MLRTSERLQSVTNFKKPQMKQFNIVFPTLIVCLFISNKLFSQELDLYHNKNSNTLIEFSEIERYYEVLNQQGPSNKGDIAIHTYSLTFGYMLLIESLGQTRKISKEKLEILGLIFKSFKLSDNIEEVFKHEVLVKTNTGLYWIPIQETLFSFWIEEMTIKKKGLIYIRAYGSWTANTENKWIFSINSFNSNYYDGLWGEALKSFKESDERNGLTCVNKLIEIEPKDGRNYFMYGFYFYKKGYPENLELLKKSDSLYKIAEKLSPNYSYGQYQKALTKAQLGEYVKAWDAIKKARSLGETRIENSFLEKLERKLPYSDYLKSR